MRLSSYSVGSKIIKTSEDTLAQQLKQATKKVEVGGIYQHYKGSLYTVLALAFEESSMEITVVYRAEYGANLTFTRLLAIWDEAVEWDNQTLPRFRLVEK